MATEYVIVVVDMNPKPFPAAKDMLHAGVPMTVATRWAKVRRTMSPKGLARKAYESRN